MRENKKPPIGITPRWLLDEKRAKEIQEAIYRYKAADYPIPIEWVEELKDLYERYHR